MVFDMPGMKIEDGDEAAVEKVSFSATFPLWSMMIHGLHNDFSFIEGHQSRTDGAAIGRGRRLADRRNTGAWSRVRKQSKRE